MVSFRDFISKLREEGRILEIEKEVSKDLELAGLVHSAGERPVFFKKVRGSSIPAAANIFPNRELVCSALGIPKEKLLKALLDAMDKPKKPGLLKTGPVLEHESDVDFSRLPVPVHAMEDGGPYLSSAIIIANDRELGRNLSFHRMMVIGKDRASVRILPRHLDEFIKRAGGELDVAVVVGSSINVLLSAAISSKPGEDELTFANALSAVGTVRLPNGIEVPADSEFAFEARITKELHDEGPFIDLTNTYDVVRRQKVVEFKKMYHRSNPVWHVLLPGGPEHKVLMGMPREPTIFREVEKAVKCIDVRLSPGGCSWLHAFVSIHKKSGGDGKKAIDAAFRGHKSLKHVVVVDGDIDVNNPAEVEWAVATRFQADRDLVIKPDEKGSSLDPSADPETRKTAKLGIDATKPLDKKEKFGKAKWMGIEISDYTR